MQSGRHFNTDIVNGEYTLLKLSDVKHGNQFGVLSLLVKLIQYCISCL